MARPTGRRARTRRRQVRQEGVDSDRVASTDEVDESATVYAVERGELPTAEREWEDEGEAGPFS